MSLYDRKGEGGNWLKEGWHRVRVKEFRLFTYNSNAPGLEFLVQDDQGQQAKASFNLLPQCQYRLASFAQACGLDDAQLKQYEPEKPNSHSKLVGRGVQVRVVPDGKYHKVDDDGTEGWAGLNEDTSDKPKPVDPRVDRSEVQDVAPPTGNDIPF